MSLIFWWIVLEESIREQSCAMFKYHEPFNCAHEAGAYDGIDFASDTHAKPSLKIPYPC